MKLKSRKLPAFTLIELLIVIAIVGIMAAAVILAINPAKRSGQARDAIRKNDIVVLADAFQAYYVTHEGLYPPPIVFSCSPSVFDVLVTSGELKVAPKDPQEPNRRYCVRIKSNSPPGTGRTEAAIFTGPGLEQPTNPALPIYCWNSITNTAFETDYDTCFMGINWGI